VRTCCAFQAPGTLKTPCRCFMLGLLCSTTVVPLPKPGSPRRSRLVRGSSWEGLSTNGSAQSVSEGSNQNRTGPLEDLS
jgi:hypothetical protein